MDIQNQTYRLVGIRFELVSLGRRKGLDPQPMRNQQPSDSLEEFVIVIHDMDEFSCQHPTIHLRRRPNGMVSGGPRNISDDTENLRGAILSQRTSAFWNRHDEQLLAAS